MEKERGRLARELKNPATRGRMVRAPECTGLPTRRNEAILSSVIFPRSNKQNLFTAGIVDLKMR